MIMAWALAISVECVENFEGFLLRMSYIRGYANQSVVLQFLLLEDS